MKKVGRYLYSFFCERMDYTSLDHSLTSILNDPEVLPQGCFLMVYSQESGFP